MTIKKTAGGYKVYSEKTGKPLSKTLSKLAAQKRLEQIEYFKNKNK